MAPWDCHRRSSWRSDRKGANDCETAIGGLAEINNNNLILKAQLFSDEGNESFDYNFTGNHEDAANIGKTVGEKLLNLAGKKFKKR